MAIFSKEEQDFLDDNLELKKRFGPYTNEFRRFYYTVKDIVGDDVDLLSRAKHIRVKILDFQNNNNNNFQTNIPNKQSTQEIVDAYKNNTFFGYINGYTKTINKETNETTIFINSNDHVFEDQEDKESFIYNNANLLFNNTYINSQQSIKQQENKSIFNDPLINSLMKRKVFYHELGHAMIEKEYLPISESGLTKEMLGDYTIYGDEIVEMHGGRPDTILENHNREVTKLITTLNQEEGIVESFASKCIRADLFDYYPGDIEKVNSTLLQMAYINTNLSILERLTEMANDVTNDALYKQWFAGNITQNQNDYGFLNIFDRNYTAFANTYYQDYFSSAKIHSFSTDTAMKYYTNCVASAKKVYDLENAQNKLSYNKICNFDMLYQVATNPEILYSELKKLNTEDDKTMQDAINTNLSTMEKNIQEFYDINIAPYLISNVDSQQK